jgi:hypothetical protein
MAREAGVSVYSGSHALTVVSDCAVIPRSGRRAEDEAESGVETCLPLGRCSADRDSSDIVAGHCVAIRARDVIVLSPHIGSLSNRERDEDKESG